MREKTNCPNCGQPITSEKCEYCGTVFYDFVNISPEEPSYLRIKYGDRKMIIAKAIGTEAEIAYGGAEYYQERRHGQVYSNCTLSVKFILGPIFENGEFFKLLQEQEATK